LQPVKKIGPGRGWAWVMAALHAVRRWPGVFGMGGLIAAGVSLLPVLGPLALAVLGPAYLAGMVIAADRAARGQTPELGDAFTLFRQQGRLRPALALCLPIVVAQVAALVTLAAMTFRTAVRLGINPAHTPSEAQLARLADAMAGGIGTWMAVAIVLMSFAYAFVVLAIPRVGLYGTSPFPAMGDSLRAVLRNTGPWIVALLSLLLWLTPPLMLLMAIRAVLLVQVLGVTAIYALVGPLLYVAWRDIAGADAADGPATPDEDAPPPPGFEA
jgi:hypothetical protein